MTNDDDRVENLFAKNLPKLRFSSRETEILRLFLAELVRWNRSINLTAIADYRRILIRHVCDSLQALTLKQVSLAGKVADVGSGAGFPGIPLAVFEKNVEVDSIEKSLKKITFQRVVKQKLGLGNFFPVYSKAEDHFGASAYSFVLSRALAPTEKALSASFPLLKPKGHCLLWKGPRFEEEWKETEPELKAKFTLKAVEEFGYPEDDFSSRIAVFKKKGEPDGTEDAEND